MKQLKRRALLSLAVAAALLMATAGCLLYSQRHVKAMPAQSAAVSSEAADPIARFRTERQQLRAKQRAELNDILHDGGTDADIHARAQQRLLSLQACEDAELRLEGLLEARGFDGVLVTVSDSAVNVLVRQQAVTRQESAAILDLALRETGVLGGNVKIIPIN